MPAAPPTKVGRGQVALGSKLAPAVDPVHPFESGELDLLAETPGPALRWAGHITFHWRVHSRTQPRRVLAVQPILVAIETIAAHCKSYPSRTQDQPNCPLAYLWRLPHWFWHDSILARNGAPANPGPIHTPSCDGPAARSGSMPHNSPSRSAIPMNDSERNMARQKPSSPNPGSPKRPGEHQSTVHFTLTLYTLGLSRIQLYPVYLTLQQGFFK